MFDAGLTRNLIHILGGSGPQAGMTIKCKERGPCLLHPAVIEQTKGRLPSLFNNNPYLRRLKAKVLLINPTMNITAFTAVQLSTNTMSLFISSVRKNRIIPATPKTATTIIHGRRRVFSSSSPSGIYASYAGSFALFCLHYTCRCNFRSAWR